MKSIGIIGGMNYFSTSAYYRNINQMINERLGGSLSAKLLLYSVDFSDYRTFFENYDWNGVEEILTNISHHLEDAGAECIVIATNAPFHVADNVSKNLKIPVLNIADTTAKEISEQKINKVGLIGSKVTMEYPFFTERLKIFNIDAIIPEIKDRNFIHKTIFCELSKGIFKNETRNKYIEIIDKLKKNGAEGIVFGCAEISLLLQQNDCGIVVFDTTELHSKAAVDFALS